MAAGKGNLLLGGAAVVVAAVVFQLSGMAAPPPSSSASPASPASTTSPASTASTASTVLPAVDPLSSKGIHSQLRRAQSERPHDGNVSAQLALALLEPVSEVAPNTADDSLYGPSLTLYHPNVAEARRLVEQALKLSPGATETHLAHQAVMMAEANGEDALQAGRKAVELSPSSAEAYAALARSHLLAACAQGCAARNSLREEKREEKKRGRRSALEAREAEQAKHEELKQARERGTGKNHLSQDRGGLRAGAMWRIMEAGRLFKQGLEAEPTSASAAALERQSRRLVALDAHKVLSTQQVFEYGECHYFYGQELDGQLCDKKRYKYE